MTGIRGMVCALLACVVLTSCGESDDPAPEDVSTAEESPATVEESSSVTPLPEPEVEVEVDPMTLAEVCPEVEAALPAAFIPGFGKMSAYVDRLNEFDELGDTETKNALGLLIPEATALMLAVARNAQGSELNDPLGAHLDGVSAFAKRCKAAGSSALQ